MRSLAYLALGLLPLWIFACSSSSSDSASGDDAGGADDAAVGDDGSAADGASADSGHKDGGSGSDAAKSDAPYDAGFDAMPLACPTPALPTTACANGVNTTFTAVATPTLLPAGTSPPYDVHAVVDSGGFFHLAWNVYSSTATPYIRYATNRTGTFVIEDVAKPAGLVKDNLDFARLVIDSCGRPTILYRRVHQVGSTNVYQLYLATKFTGGWFTEEIVVPTSASDATPVTDFEAVDLTIDPQFHPVVASRRYTSAPIVVSTKGATGWTHDFTGLTTSGINLPRVVWSSTLGAVLAYSHSGDKPSVGIKNGSTWTETVLTSSTAIDSFGVGDESVIVETAAPNGTVHLAYVTYDNAAMKRLLHYTSIASSAGGFTAPVSVPMPYSGLPIPMRIFAPTGLEPRITFEQFNGAQNQDYLSTMSSGIFGAATSMTASFYEGNGSTIDGNGRVHLFASRYNGTSSSYVSDHATQGCAP